ncbi:DUF11 domain-containing protein [Streptomyces sp. NPDC097595]|uniref:DUF11 domain-containing protein n=1 Tax=Streptomyces sp. NPDC097595 TaxID=3366090 RepID=UPI003820AB03
MLFSKATHHGAPARRRFSRGRLATLGGAFALALTWIVPLSAPASAAAACDVTSITPNRARVNQEVNMVITGHGFTDEANCGRVSQVSIVGPTSVTLRYELSITDTTVTVYLPGLPEGSYSVSPATGTGATPWGSATHTVGDDQADLAVALTATPAPLLSSAIVYTQTVTNNGPSGLAEGTVTTTLPSQTSNVTGLPTGCSYSSPTKTVTCTVSGLANGATATRTFTAGLNLVSLGDLPATATRTTSSPADTISTNDSATAHCSALTSVLIAC